MKGLVHTTEISGDVTDLAAAGMVKVKWATGGHTSTPVPIYAFGRAQSFSGVYETTEVPKRIAKLLQREPFPRSLD